MLRSLIAVSVATALAASAFAGLKWETKPDKAFAAAKKSKKIVLIDFYTDWCGWCKKLDKDTYPSKTVQSHASDFVWLKVDAEKMPELAKKYNVTGYPTIVFARPDGKAVNVVIGYRTPAQFVAEMTKALKPGARAAGGSRMVRR